MPSLFQQKRDATVAGWTALQTRNAAQASRKEAEAATRTIEEMRRDRDLSWQPYLITGHATVAAQRTTTVINIGRGPAVNCLYANRFRGAWAKKGVFGLGPSQEEVMWTPEAAAPPIPAALFEYKGLELDNVDQVEAIFCQDVVQDKVFRFIYVTNSAFSNAGSAALAGSPPTASCSPPWGGGPRLRGTECEAIRLSGCNGTVYERAA